MRKSTVTKTLIDCLIYLCYSFLVMENIIITTTLFLMYILLKYNEYIINNLVQMMFLVFFPTLCMKYGTISINNMVINISFRNLSFSTCVLNRRLTEKKLKESRNENK